MLTFLWYPKLNLSLFWGPAIAIFQPTTDWISLVHETIPLPCIMSCATPWQSTERVTVCKQHCPLMSAIRTAPGITQSPPAPHSAKLPRSRTLSRPAELCSFPCVPSASKKPLCETARAAWKSWAGKLFDEKRKLFPNEIFSTKCSISSLTIEVVGNFHLKIFPMKTRFPPPVPSYPASPPFSK